MSRVKIKFPEQKPLHTASIAVRITDVNYGGHVGNDSILSIIHEARMLALKSGGFSELNAGGNGMIMADVMIAYKGEAFYGDVLDVAIYAEEISGSSFDLLYMITTIRGDKTINIAQAKTGMVCFDYARRRPVAIGEDFRLFLEGK